MDIRQMEYFNTICETGNMSAAAQKLFVSQQALSKSIEHLEKEIGLQLLIRGKKGIQLTREGKIFLDEVQYVIRSNQRLQSRIDAIKHEKIEKFRIQFFSGMLMQLPKGYLENFILKHPEVDFEISSYLDNSQSREHLNMCADLFFSTNKVHMIGLELMQEFHFPLRLLVSKDHELTEKEEIRLSDLKNYPVMAINSDYASQHHLEKRLAKNSIYIQYRLGDGELDFMLWLIRNQKTVSFWAGSDADAPEGTFALDVKDLDIAWNLYIYGREERLPSVATEMLDDIRSFWNVKQK